MKYEVVIDERTGMRRVVVRDDRPVWVRRMEAQRRSKGVIAAKEIG